MESWSNDLTAHTAGNMMLESAGWPRSRSYLLGQTIGDSGPKDPAGNQAEKLVLSAWQSRGAA